MKQRLEKLFKEKVNGKVVLITGASSGIGLTVAHRLAGAGAELVTTEMVMFEWLRTCEDPAFKEMLALVK